MGWPCISLSDYRVTLHDKQRLQHVLWFSFVFERTLFYTTQKWVSRRKRTWRQLKMSTWKSKSQRAKWPSRKSRTRSNCGPRNHQYVQKYDCDPAWGESKLSSSLQNLDPKSSQKILAAARLQQLEVDEENFPSLAPKRKVNFNLGMW